MTYVISTEGDLTIVRFLSDPVVEELSQLIERSDDFASALELWDLTDRALGFTSQQMRALAELAKAKQRHPEKTAIVADRDVSFGMSRLYCAYRRNGDGETDVFRDEDAARAWLFTKD